MIMLFIIQLIIICHSTVIIENTISNQRVELGDSFNYTIPSSTFNSTDGSKLSVFVNSTSLPSFLSTEYTKTSFHSLFSNNGLVYKIVGDGDYIFLATKNMGLMIFSVADPQKPVFLGNVYDGLIPTLSLDCKNDYCYLSTGQTYMYVVDVSDKTNPRITRTLTAVCSDGCEGVQIKNNFLFVTDRSDGIHILDISNPDFPTLSLQLDLNSRAMNVFVQDNYAYIADELVGLQIVKINATNTTFAGPPELLSVTHTPPALFVYVEGNYTYLSDEVGLKIFEISDPKNPALVANVSVGAVNGIARYGVIKIGNYTYLGGYNFGIAVINVTNITYSKLIGFIPSNTKFVKSFDFLYHNNYLFLAGYDDGFGIYDIHSSLSTLFNPILLSKRNLVARVEVVRNSKDKVYVGGNNGGLWIYDLLPRTSSTSTLVKLKKIIWPGEKVFGMDVVGEYVYLALPTNGFAIYGIQEDSMMESESLVASSGQSRGVRVDNTEVAAYVASRSGGLDVYNVTKKSNFSFVRTVPLILEEFYDVFYTPEMPDYIFISAYKDGVLIYDISDRHDPQNVGQCVPDPPIFKVKDVFVDGKYAYAALSNFGINVFDISDVGNCKLVWNISVSTNYIRDVFKKDDNLYVSVDNVGVYIFDTGNYSAAPNLTRILPDTTMPYSVIAVDDSENPLLVVGSYSYKLYFYDLKGLKISGTPQACGNFPIHVWAREKVGPATSPQSSISLEFELLVRKQGYLDDKCEVFSCFGILSNDSLVCSGSKRGNCSDHIVSTNGTQFVCVCNENYYGDNCNRTTCQGLWSNGSSQAVCNHGNGTCTEYNFCTCNEGYHGNECDIYECNSILSTSTSVCNGKGECIDYGNCDCNASSSEQNYINSFCELAELEDIIDPIIAFSVEWLTGLFGSVMMLLLITFVVFVPCFLFVFCLCLCCESPGRIYSWLGSTFVFLKKVRIFSKRDFVGRDDDDDDDDELLLGNDDWDLD